MAEASLQMKKHTEGVVYLLYLLACALQYRLFNYRGLLANSTVRI
jgi:hypothetical protein